MAHRSLLIPHRYHHNNNFNFYLKEHNLKHSENFKGASCKYGFVSQQQDLGHFRWKRISEKVLI